jgi:predicted MFS family arabinose efflux permease
MIAAVLRLSLVLFLIQAGYHGFTVAIPLALSRAGRTDAEIGTLVGLATLIQIPAALIAGALIDRYGGIRLVLVGGLFYLASVALLLLPGVEPATSTVAIGVARALQGIGFGIALPAALALVPRLVQPARRGIALGTATVSHNLSYIALPPISIVILDAWGLDGVSLVVGLLVSSALAVVLARPLHVVSSVESVMEAASRKFGFALRSSWLSLLAITVLFTLHWGVIVAYLPQRADLAGANVGVFFVADGIFVMLSRIPAGWLADRTRPAIPIVAGILVTLVGVGLLLLPLSTPLIFVSGLLTGVGAALIVAPILLELTRRSADADRGSAFALYSAAFAAGSAIGAVATAPLIEGLGFEVVLAVALAALLASVLVALADRELWKPVSTPTREEALAVDEVGAQTGP